MGSSNLFVLKTIGIMKVLLALSALLSLALASQTLFPVSRDEVRASMEFVRWMKLHSKSYNHEEFQKRKDIFIANLRFVETHNANVNHTYKVAMNQFGDMTGEEFSKFYKGLKYDAKKFDHSKVRRGNATGAPTNFDWRDKGAVTHVKNQEQCGSCWSFSTTGSTEGCHKLAGHDLVSLSEQNLVDCSTSYGNQGCNGGLMTDAMEYIIQNKGIDTESSYPYTASDGTCHYNAANSAATLSSYTNVAQGDETDLLAKCVLGPVSVAIDASHSSFQFYSSGVYYEPDCSSTELDHGVLAAGWGVEGGQDYWLVKNSWGASWGLSGFIKMARNRNNNCGIATSATLPHCQ